MYAKRPTNVPDAPPMELPSTGNVPFRPLSKHGLHLGMPELSSNTAAGEDWISREELQPFNRCLKRVPIPKEWFSDIVVPLLKPVKPALDMTSFRPVTLTSTMCKCIEGVVVKEPLHASVSWETEYKLLHSEQSGSGITW
ncbi:hypothetical protein, unlikely [Trypanosoma congolense IL3000]|uniref:Uncharacterized protein n=1 Tax=Trypanosoma congolense (strain IL3000) TaxID=1068625 RepID=F9WJU7_TRYCI|nr:hypothetical protein, unlikely [Trypanosoma congolense IL3000]